jgi:phosphate-selective porin
VRHSEIDLNSSDVFGGAQTNDAIALNYYATESIRFSLNYIEASARPNSDGVDEDVSIIQGRFQFIF